MTVNADEKSTAGSISQPYRSFQTIHQRRFPPFLHPFLLSERPRFLYIRSMCF